MTQWIDIALDTWVWDGLQIHQRKNKRAKREKWVVSPLFLYPHHDLRTPKDGGRGYKSTRAIGNLLGYFSSSLPLHSHRVTWEGRSTETSLDNSKLSLANVLIIPELVMRGWAWESRDKTSVPATCSFAEDRDPLLADTNLWRVSPQTRVREDLGCF